MKTVAILGIPNVGKSSLFNRLIQEKNSIVADIPGVTRDRIYGKCEWQGNTFSVIDTGGIVFNDQDNINVQVQKQTQLAIEEADLILFMISGRDEISKDELIISKNILKTKKPALLVINKIDGNNTEISDNVWSLGFNEHLKISTLHGIGIGDLLDKITECLKEVHVDESDFKGIKFALIGKPNAGKSSIVNAILQDDISIVDSKEHTTRDVLEREFEFEGKSYKIIDTPGIRKKTILDDLQYYGFLRVMKLIPKVDMIGLVIDAKQGISTHDSKIIEIIIEAKKPVFILFNKKDLLSNEEMEKLKKSIEVKLPFVKNIFTKYCSAIKNFNTKMIFDTLIELEAESKKVVPTSVLNDIIMNIQLVNPPKYINQKQFKIYYAYQVKNSQIPTFILHINKKDYLQDNYLKYIYNSFYKSINISGLPFQIYFNEKRGKYED